MINCNTFLSQFEHTKEILIEDIVNGSYKAAINYIKERIEELDNEIFNHPSRKQQYKIKGFYNRTILTKVGSVTYKRRLYIEKLTGDNLFLVDMLIGINPYSRITNDAIILLAQNAIYMKSYRQSGEVSIPNVIVSKQTVANCIDKVSLVEKDITQKINTDTIHVAIDGFFANYMGFSRKKETKFASIYTTKRSVGNRNVLINRYIVTEKEKESFLFTLSKELFRRFNISNDTKLYFCGDGAPWIKQLASHFINAEFVIDKFHLMRAIKHIPNPELFVEAINSQDYSNLNKIERLCNTDLEKANYKYVVSHLKYTKAWLNSDFVGTMAENVVSHVFNSRIRSIPRNWGKRLKIITNGLVSYSNNELMLEIKDGINTERIYKTPNDLFLPILDIKARFNNDVGCPIIDSGKSLTRDAIKALLY
jgi:hypothetical protein